MIFRYRLLVAVMFVALLSSDFYPQWQQAGGTRIMVTLPQGNLPKQFGNGVLAASLYSAQVGVFSEASQRWLFGSGVPTDLASGDIVASSVLIDNYGVVLTFYPISILIDGELIDLNRCLRSLDSGRTWKEVLIEGRPFSWPTAPFATDNGTLLYPLNPLPPFDTLQRGMTAISTDHGDTWVKRDYPDSAVAFARYSPSGRIEVGTRDGRWYASDDLANHWQPIDTATLQEKYVSGAHGIWYGYNGYDYNSFLRSTDGGASFQVVTNEHCDDTITANDQFSIVDADSSSILLNRRTKGDAITRLYYSTDAGRTIRRYPDGDWVRRAYLHTPSVITINRLNNDGTESFVTTTNGGTTWSTRLTCTDEYIVNVAATDDYLYLFTGSGLVFQYSIASSMLDTVQAGLPEGIASKLAQFTNDGTDVLVISTQSHGVLASSIDGGESFTLVDGDCNGMARSTAGDAVTATTYTKNNGMFAYDGSSKRTIPTSHPYPADLVKNQASYYSCGGIFGQYDSRTLRYLPDDSSPWTTLHDSDGDTTSKLWQSFYESNLVAVVPLSSGSNALFVAADQTSTGSGMPGDTTLDNLGGLLIHDPSNAVVSQPLTAPFNNQQWVFDVLALGGDSVLVAIGSYILFEGLHTPSLSSGTLWKGSLTTLEFKQVFDGRTDEDHAYNLGWQFARDSSGRIYASATSGGIIWSHDNGETWHDFDYEAVRTWTINDICVHKNMLFAATTKGLFKRDLPTSVNGGDNDGIYMVQVESTPNPSASNIKLTIRGLDTIRMLPWTVAVVDIMGRTMTDLTATLQQQAGSPIYYHSLDVSQWPTGMYILTVNAAQYSRSFTIAVAR